MDESKKENFVLDQKELVETKEFHFGKEAGKTTRLSFIGYTVDSVVVTFFNRKGESDSSWQYYNLEPQLAKKLYDTVVSSQTSIGKTFNELFFNNRIPVFAGRKITII